MILVSIIIPYVEDRGYLDEAINSIYSQTYGGKIEVILSQSKHRVGHNLNQGIKKAKGEFIKYLCDDDLLTRNSIEDSVNAMKGVDFIHGKAVEFNRYNQTRLFIPKIKYPTLEHMIKQNIIHGGSLMYRRDVFERFGLFDEKLTTGEEYDFNMKILSKGAKIGYCDQTLYLYRRHDEQKSLGVKSNQKKRQLIIDKIREKYA
jgi:teichuronic acid biosynthesis glycosyltransferase TuaG